MNPSSLILMFERSGLVCNLGTFLGVRSRIFIVSTEDADLTQHRAEPSSFPTPKRYTTFYSRFAQHSSCLLIMERCLTRSNEQDHHLFEEPPESYAYAVRAFSNKLLSDIQPSILQGEERNFRPGTTVHLWAATQETEKDAQPCLFDQPHARNG
jgi:hypothetical protein